MNGHAIYECHCPLAYKNKETKEEKRQSQFTQRQLFRFVAWGEIKASHGLRQGPGTRTRSRTLKSRLPSSSIKFTLLSWYRTIYRWECHDDVLQIPVCVYTWCRWQPCLAAVVFISHNITLMNAKNVTSLALLKAPLINTPTVSKEKKKKKKTLRHSIWPNAASV